MSVLQEILLKNGYKLPKENDFQSKVREYFGISEFSKAQDIFYLPHPRGYEIDLKQQFINTYEVELYYLQEMKILEIGIFNEDNNRFVCYNKIMFNDDILCITQIFQDKRAVEDLVIYFDYEKNPMLLNFALNNLDVSNAEIIYLEHIVFYNNKTKEDPIKKEILLKVIEKNEDFFISIIQNLINFWEGFSVKDSYKYKALAFLFEELLKKHNKKEHSIMDNRGYIILNNSYVEKKIILDHFVKKNYYEYKLLKKYSETYTLLLDEEYENLNDNRKESLKNTFLFLYDRPDFSSFSRKIEAKDEIEYLNMTSGWDYVKVNGTVGYLPEEIQQENKKNNFLADD